MDWERVVLWQLKWSREQNQSPVYTSVLHPVDSLSPGLTLPHWAGSNLQQGPPASSQNRSESGVEHSLEVSLSQFHTPLVLWRRGLPYTICIPFQCSFILTISVLWRTPYRYPCPGYWSGPCSKKLLTSATSAAVLVLSGSRMTYLLRQSFQCLLSCHHPLSIQQLLI